MKDIITKVKNTILKKKLVKQHSPNIQYFHPEADNSMLLDKSGIQIYQVLMGIDQWIIIIGCIDLCYVIKQLSRFNKAPRKGYLNFLEKVY